MEITLKEYFENKLALNEHALQLQAREDDRRLDALNGEAERLRKMQETYIERSVYNIAHDFLMRRVEAIEKMVYVGLGIILTVQWIFHYFK